jgi:hypothetical protein
VAPDEAPLLRDIEALLKRTLPVAPLPVFKVSAAAPAAAERDSSGTGAHRHGPRPARNTQGARRAGGRTYHSNGFARARRSV